MTTKELRKKIRQCKTPDELKKVCDEVASEGYSLAAVSQWGTMDIADFSVFSNMNIIMRFPMMGLRRFKNVREFSYRIKIGSKTRYGSARGQCYIVED